MKSVMIYPNFSKPRMIEHTISMIKYLSARGVQIYISNRYKDLFDDIYKELVKFVDFKMCVKLCDLIVVLGGDGTVLSVAKSSAIYKKPVIGINLGHLGFMTELEIEDINLIDEIFIGNYEVDTRMMLDVSIIRNSSKIFSDVALNDIVITKGDVFKIINTTVFADDISVLSVNGDGVIVCTPTGSTAYSLSAGGPIVEPCAENIIVTPICAHALHAKSYVFSKYRTIKIEAKSKVYSKIFVSIDGKDGVKLLPNDFVIIESSKLTFSLLRIKKNGFYKTLKSKISNGSDNFETSEAAKDFGNYKL